MIILTTAATAQTMSVIPRQYDDSAFTIRVKDDSTNVTVDYLNRSGTTVGNYLKVNIAFSPILVEAHFYDLFLFVDYNFWNTNNRFCTDQDIDQLNDNDHYQLNKDQYTFYDGFDNTYTVR